MCFKCAGLPVVDRGGVDPNSLDLPFAHEPSRRIGMQAPENGALAPPPALSALCQDTVAAMASIGQSLCRARRSTYLEFAHALSPIA